MVEPTWQSRDFPVLCAIVEAMEEHPGSEARLEEIAQRSGLGRADVDKAIVKLWAARPPYFEAITVEETHPIAVTSVTERALRETEQWPNPASIVDELIAAFSRAADSEQEPERKSRFRTIANGLSGFARDVAVGVISNKLSGL
jgi:hypothetical protein